MIKNNNKGFSLIELMVVVGIIGILAAVAVPNLLKFQAKAKQSNAKTELSALYGLEKAFSVEYAIYSGNLKALGFAPDGVPSNAGCVTNNADVTDAASGTSGTWPIRYYAVGFAAAEAGKLPGALPVGTVNCATAHVQNTVRTIHTPGGTVTNSANGAVAFNIIAMGNISTDTGALVDTWTMTQAKKLTNTIIGY